MPCCFDNLLRVIERILKLFDVFLESEDLGEAVRKRDEPEVLCVHGIIVSQDAQLCKGFPVFYIPYGAKHDAGVVHEKPYSSVALSAKEAPKALPASRASRAT